MLWRLHYLIRGFLKLVQCLSASSVILPSSYNTEERCWLRKSSKSSDSSIIFSTAPTPWTYCAQEICCADFVDGYNPFLFFSFWTFVCLFLFLLRRVSRNLFLKSFKSFQAVCIGVCVDRLAMLPQYHLGDILHDRILPSSIPSENTSPAASTRNEAFSAWHYHCDTENYGPEMVQSWRIFN